MLIELKSYLCSVYLRYLRKAALFWVVGYFLLLRPYVKCWNHSGQMLHLRTDTISQSNCMQSTDPNLLHISTWCSKSKKKKKLWFCFEASLSDVLLNRASVTSPLCRKHPHCPPQRRTLKPLARPVETGCPCCLDIWPLQHKPLIFCGSFLAFLQQGRVVWIMSPICEAAGFRSPSPPPCLLCDFEEAIHVLPGGLPLWPASLFFISSWEEHWNAKRTKYIKVLF